MIPAADIFRPPLPLHAVAPRLLVCSVPSVLGFMLWESSRVHFIGGPGAFLAGLVFFALAAGVISLIAGSLLYLLFRVRDWHSWWTFTLAGAIPAPLIFYLITNPAFLAPGTMEFSGGCQAVDHGVMTACGWVGYFGALGEFAVFGALAGLVFWLLLRWRNPAR